ncbi:succinate dehydrogenase assembly factor 2 [Sphingomonas daechungensis]|uniref:succinate dehydrogenase assembly factor 2 n=1 Tax=Sphingomonas daechungensis TaxID=1176646 RepID=UPI0037D9A985
MLAPHAALAIQTGNHYIARMLPDEELRRLHWRAHHRGTREADMLIGGFFDTHGESWSADERVLFNDMLNEQDVDIMAWAIGTAEAPRASLVP